jgi:hypothetical protein
MTVEQELAALREELARTKAELTAARRSRSCSWKILRFKSKDSMMSSVWPRTPGSENFLKSEGLGFLP